MFMMFLYASVERGGGAVSKKFFQAFWPQFGLKVRGGSGPPTPPLDLPLYMLAFVAFR